MTEQDKANLTEALRLVRLVANNNAGLQADAMRMSARGEMSIMSDGYRNMVHLYDAELNLCRILRT